MDFCLSAYPNIYSNDSALPSVTQNSCSPWGNSLWCISVVMYDGSSQSPTSVLERIMTENTAPETTTEVVEETPQVPARDTLDPLSQALLTATEPKMAELQKIAAKQAAAGDVGKLMTEAISSSTDDDVIKRRQAVEKANEAILRLTKEMEELVRPTLAIPTDEELNEYDLQYKVLASEVNSFNNAFQVETSKAFEGLTVFDYLGDMPGKRRGAKAGQGTGTARPRVAKIEYTTEVNSDEFKAAEKNGKSTFSVLSQIIKEETGEVISAGDFHEAWTSQNGKTDWTQLPEVSTFVYSFTDGDAKTHEYKVRVTK